MGGGKQMPGSDNADVYDSVVPLSKYDLFLAFIPATFLVAVSLAHVLSLSTRSVMVAASVVAALALADALFVHPPRSA